MRKSILLDGFSDENNSDSVIRKKSEETYLDHQLSMEIDLECEISSSMIDVVQDRAHQVFELLIRWFINLVFSCLQFVVQYSHTHAVPKASRTRFEKKTESHKMKEIVIINSRFSAWIMEEVLWGLHHHSQYSNQDTHCVGCSFPETIRRLGSILGSAESQDRALVSLVLNRPRQMGSESLDFRPLFDNLATNTTLKHLNISGLQLNDKSAESLVKCLQKNHALQTLILTDCGLSITPMTLLLENLGFYFGLRRLYLNGRQQHGHSGHQVLVDLAIRALKAQNNYTLEALFMPPGFDLFRSELDVLLDWNLGGRRTMLRHDNPSNDGRRRLHKTPKYYPPAVWPYVLERINTLKLPSGYRQTEQRRAARRAEMVYFMLRQHFLLEA